MRAHVPPCRRPAPVPRRVWRLAGWLWLLGVLFGGTSAWAETRLQLEVSSQRVGLDEELQVVVSAVGGFDALSELSSEGFDFRNAGRSTQVTILNGAMQRVESFTFVGTPLKAGRYTLGPVVATDDGQVVGKSGTVQVEVVGEQEPSGPVVAAEQAEDLARYVGQPAFVRVVLSAKQVYAGQPLVLTWELMWSARMQSQGVRMTSAPRYGNLDVIDLLKDGQKTETVKFGGQHYQRLRTHQVLLTSAAAGTVRIDGPAFKLEVGDFFETRTLKVAGPAVDLTVLAVPTDGRPAGYQEGNVGQMRVQAALQVAGKAAQQHTVQTGERLLLQIEVSGKGNLLGLAPLRPPTVEGMTVEDLPGRSDQGITKGPEGASGRRSWQYVLSFAQPGRYILPAQAWASFDPQQQRFVAQSWGPFTVEVQGAAVVPTPQVGSTATAATAAQPADGSGQPPRAAAEPVTSAARPGVPPRPIAASADLAAGKAVAWHAQPWFWGVALAAWPLALLSVLGRWWQRRRARQAPARRRAEAPLRAQQRLAVAANLSPTQGYAEARMAVLDFLQEAAGMPAGGWSETVLASHLRGQGAAQDVVEGLLRDLQHCDYARYAPAESRTVELQACCTRLAAGVVALAATLKPDAGGKAAVGTAGLRPDGASRKGAALGMLLVAAAVSSVTPPLHAAGLDATFAQANRDYVAGRADAAAAGYRTLLHHGVQAPAVHYNLGNALYRQQKLGSAVAHYLLALRSGASGAVHDDAQANLAAARTALAEQARRRHETFHVFDESPEADVAFARAAPRGVLAAAGVAAGLACLLAVVLWLRGRRGGWTLGGGIAALLVHAASLGWLAQAQYTDASVVHAVVVQEDAPLAPCQGVGDSLGLPEGIEVRRLRELADGRVEVRMTNGRQGCVAAQAVQVLQ